MSEVLACIDFSDATDAVVTEAARLAVLADHRLHLVHVAAPEPDLVGYDPLPIALSTYTRDDRAAELLDEHQRLRELAATLQAQGLSVVPLVAIGPTVEVILAEAEHIDAGVIVVGSHGHGKLHDLLLGSVSHGIMRHSTRPVLVVPVAER